MKTNEEYPNEIVERLLKTGNTEDLFRVLCSSWLSLRKRLKRIRIELLDAQENLLQYGRHLDLCAVHRGHDCSCGWDELREAMKK